MTTSSVFRTAIGRWLGVLLLGLLGAVCAEIALPLGWAYWRNQYWFSGISPLPLRLAADIVSGMVGYALARAMMVRVQHLRLVCRYPPTWLALFVAPFVVWCGQRFTTGFRLPDAVTAQLVS